MQNIIFDSLGNLLKAGDQIRVAHYWAHGNDAVGHLELINNELIVNVDCILVNNTLGSLERLIRIGWKVYKLGVD